MNSNTFTSLFAVRYLCLAVLAVLQVICMPAMAWDFSSTDQTTEHSVQLRAGADFTKKFNNGIRLHAAEDLRFDVYNSLSGASFNKSYTTLSFAYAPVKYFKVDAGYTLKIMGNKDWADVNKWMRHRAFFSVTGAVKAGRWRFSLRERALCEVRMGDIDLYTAENLYEHNRADWYLRSKVEVQYSSMSKPLKPYLWVELVNTLNANELQQKYKDNNPTNQGHQYIRRVRTALGVTWKLDKRNALNFYYRFNYGYDRDVNVKPNKQTILLTEETSFQHAIGVNYEFGW